MYRSIETTVCSATFSAWQLLAITGGINLSVAPNDDGRLQVFVLQGNGTLVTVTQVQSGSGVWHPSTQTFARPVSQFGTNPTMIHARSVNGKIVLHLDVHSYFFEKTQTALSSSGRTAWA